MSPNSSSGMLCLLILLSISAADPAAASAVGQPIELQDDTPSGTVLDNLDHRLQLGGSRAAWSALKLMNPPTDPGSAIIDGLAINSSSAQLYATRRLDRDDLCRPARHGYGQRRQRIKRHPCCNTVEPCELSLSVSHPTAKNVEQKVLSKLSLLLRDDNDNEPKFSVDSVTLRVAEGEIPPSRLSSTGRSISSLTASDPDQGANGRIEYRLAAGDNLPFRLERDRDGGFKRMSLVTTAVLDREETDSYTLHLLAVDSGRPQLTGTLSLTVSVTDINDARPIFEKRTYEARLPEDSPVGSPVTRVLATDGDAGQNGAVDYFLTGGPHAGMFRVERSADGHGVVSLSRKLDAESAKPDPRTGEAVLELLLVARDRGSPARSSEAQLAVTVVDVNDETPEVAVVYMSNDPQRGGRGLLPENSPTPVDVARVHVSDGDSGRGGEVDCKLSEPAGAGSIPAGGFVLVPDATAGPGQNDQTFNLRSTRPLDREQRATVELTVVCADRGHPPAASLTGSAAVRLRILDQNDNSPRFKVPAGGAFRFRLPENEPPTAAADVGVGAGPQQRRSLGFVQAEDADEAPNDKLVYTLVPGVPTSISEGAFQIDASTGELFAVRPFDREDSRLLLAPKHSADGAASGRSGEAQVSLQVSVRDADPTHVDTAHVVVTIEDRNDNAPLFQSSNYNFRVAEEARDYRVVGTVTAVDADQAAPSTIEYRMDKDVEHEVRRLFRLNPTSGTISLLDKLDRETRSAYEFRVVALDGKIGSGGGAGGRVGVRNTGTATVIVEVTDVNDCKPRFLQPTDGQVLELPVGVTAGYSVMEAKATDSDLGENGRVSYSLIDPPNSGLEIDKSTGLLFVVKIVSPRSPGQSKQFSLTLEARDHGSPTSLKSTVRVWIRIVDSSKYPTQAGGGGPAGEGNGKAGKDSFPVSQRMRATVVIGLIVFFFLLLLLAAAAALVLLRPCRRPRRRLPGDGGSGRGPFGLGGDKLDSEGNILEDAEAADGAMKEARLAGGFTARQFAVGTLRCGEPGSEPIEHYNLIPTLAHSIDGNSIHPFAGKVKQPSATMNSQSVKQLSAATAKTAGNYDYQMLRLQPRPDTMQHHQPHHHTYYQISNAATVRRGEADGGLTDPAAANDEDTTVEAGQTPTARRHQQQGKRQRPNYDPTAGASFV